MPPTFDERDAALLGERAALRASESKSVLSGDYVRFACGTLRRVSHVWDWQDGSPVHVQTSDLPGSEKPWAQGSWHLHKRGDGSYSGGLYPGVPGETLTATSEWLPAPYWFFHHDHACAHNGVHVLVPSRVWECSEVAPC